MGTTKTKSSIVFGILLISLSLFFSFTAPLKVKAAPTGTGVITLSGAPTVDIALGERFSVTADISGYDTNEYWAADVQVKIGSKTFDLYSDTTLQAQVESGPGVTPGTSYKDWVDSLPSGYLSVGNSNGSPLEISIVVNDPDLVGSQQATVGFVRNAETDRSEDINGIAFVEVESAPVTLKFIEPEVIVTAVSSVPLGERFNVTVEVKGFAPETFWHSDVIVNIGGTDIDIINDPDVLRAYVGGTPTSGGTPFEVWAAASSSYGFAVGNSTNTGVGGPITLSVVVDDSSLAGSQSITVKFVSNSNTARSETNNGSSWLGDLESDAVVIEFTEPEIIVTEPSPTSIDLGAGALSGYEFEVDGLAASSWFQADLAIFIDGAEIDPTDTSKWLIEIDSGSGYMDYASWMAALTSANGGFAAGNTSGSSIKVKITPEPTDRSLHGDHTFSIEITLPSDGRKDYSNISLNAGANGNWFPTGGIISDEYTFTVVDPNAPVITFVKFTPPDAREAAGGVTVPAPVTVAYGSVFNVDNYAPTGNYYNANGDYVFAGWATTPTGLAVSKLTIYNANTGVFYSSADLVSFGFGPGTRVSGTITVTSSLTLYALWVKPAGAPLTAVPDMISLYLAPAGLAVAALALLHKRSRKESE
jgi:hypothetical protein